MARNKSEHQGMSAEKYQEWLSQQEVFKRGDATYVVIDGVEYPLGLEPDPTLTGRDLMIARKKEEVWMWSLRFGLLGMALIVLLIFFFSATA